MSTSVKHFRYSMTGAPTLNGTAGSLIAVLDACLVNGFNLKTLDSITVANGVATASVGAGHGFATEAVILVAGVTETALNGEKRVATAPSTSLFTFNASGVPDGTYTGTITAKVAPAGWEKVYAGTNKAVYRSADITGTRMFLRAVDTDANNARVTGYESMTDVDTGVNAFPTSGQMSGGYYWPKASDTSATARGWELFADSRTFYIHLVSSTSANLEAGVLLGFGDFASLKSGDAYACMLGGLTGANHANNSTAYGESFHYSLSSAWSAAGLAVARSYTTLGASTLVNRRSYGIDLRDVFSGTSGVSYPNGANNGLLVQPVALAETTAHWRGQLRGCYHVPQNCQSAFSGGQHMDAQGDLSGRRLAVVKGGYVNAGSSLHMSLIDITGPWE